MKVCSLLVGAFLVSGAILSAQETETPRYEIGVNYSWLHVNSANFDYQRTGNGGSGYIVYNIDKITGLVADFGGYANTRKGIDGKALTYMFGPRFTFRHWSKVTPYTQFLFGGAYAWSGPNNSTQNGFALAAGGGLDYNWTKRISIKPIQVEYVMTQLDTPALGVKNFGNHQNDVRYSAGVVFKFGEQ